MRSAPGGFAPDFGYAIRRGNRIFENRHFQPPSNISADPGFEAFS
jgi:hypothetical protein